MVITCLVIVLTMMLTPVLIISTILGAVKLKQKIHNMNQEKWSAYFSNMSVKGYMYRTMVFILIPLMLISIIGYALLQTRNEKKKAFLLMCVIFLLNGVKISYRLITHKEELIGNIMDIKESALENDENSDL